MKTRVTKNIHSSGQSRSLPLFLTLFLFFQTTGTLTHCSFKPTVHQQVTTEQTEAFRCIGSPVRFLTSLKAADRTASVSDALFSTAYQRLFLQQQHAHISKIRLSPSQDNILAFRDKRQASFHSRRIASTLSEIPSDIRSA